MRTACVLLVACVLLGGAAAAQTVAEPAPEKWSRIYGVEVESVDGGARVLIFADGPVAPVQIPVNARSVTLSFPSSQLDPSAPKRVRGAPGSGVSFVSVFERADADPPEVRVVVRHSSSAKPTLSQRGNVVALTIPSGSGPTAANPRSGRSRPKPQPGATASSEPTMPARMIGVDVLEAVKRLARFIEEPLILPDNIRGRVSLDVPEPVTKTEARALLEALLLLRGFAAVQTPGGIRKVVPITGDIGPWVTDLAEGEGEMLLTTMVKLEQIDADLVIQAIKPLVGTKGLAIPHPPSNAIILGGAVPRLRRLIDVIRELDQSGPRKLVMLRLEYADAVTTADALNEAFDGLVTALDVWPDERTNRLIVRGRPETVEDVRKFVSRLDRPPAGHGKIQVLPVRFADVDRMAEMLRDLQAAPTSVGSALAGRNFSVSVHGPTHALVVKGDNATIEVIRDVLAEVDISPDRIDVEVIIAEVTLNEGYTFGLSVLTPLFKADEPDDLIAFLVLDSGNTILPELADRLTNPMPGPRNPTDFIPDGALQSVLTYDPLAIPIVGPGGVPVALAASFGVDASELGVNTRLLMRPRLTVLNGAEHEIFAGNNIPIPVSNTADASNPLLVSQNVERQDVGVNLRLQPTVSSDEVVVLDLNVEINGIAQSASLNNSVGGTGVILQNREIESRVRLHPGQVAVIAWASAPQVSKRVIGTPFFQSIPIIGWLFRRVEERTQSVNLFVMARATVLRPEVRAMTEWMRQSLERQPSEDSLEGDAP